MGHCHHVLCLVQEWAANNKVPMLQQQVKPQAAINTTTLYKTEEEVTVAPTNILQVVCLRAVCGVHTSCLPL